MTAFEMILEKIHADMVPGNLHCARRDLGRLAGGYRASNSLSAVELHHLEQAAISKSSSPKTAEKEWHDGVQYGMNEPIAWEAHNCDEGYALAWDAEIGGKSEGRIVAAEWIQDAEITEPVAWDPVNDLTRYLSALFDGEDQVGYVTEAWLNKDNNRWLPSKGVFDRTAVQLIDALSKCKGDIGAVVGDVKPEVGAWIRFNPLDGKGVRDENVTKYRFALVESDVVAIPRQMALMTELELPIAALVHSGGKSLHAIVKVDADSMTEYRERVDYLFEVCRKNGLEMDRQNRNPSRLSRMPGVMRNGHKQWLIATNIGKPSWGEWKEWVEDLKDDLPDIIDLDIGSTEPELAPVLIEGILREGHKMLIAGPSKAGKSFALIQLAIAFAEGGEWFGWKVRQGRVLYVNLELDARSDKHRFWKIYDTLGKQQTKGMIDVWELRGNSTSLDKLAPKLIRRAGKKGYSAVIIDPIYKVLTGDENSAEQMALFCNQFDRICKQLGAATIYCHHHSKGAQGQKNSKDRSSGSGVFARDPDAILDMIELILTDACRKQVSNRWQCEAMQAVLNEQTPGWWQKCPQDDAVVADKLMEWAGLVSGLPEARRDAIDAVKETSAWRIEATLREFRRPEPKRVFFRYPVHVVDTDEILKDAKADGEESPQEVFLKKRAEQNEARKKEAHEKVLTAIDACRTEDGVMLSEVAEYLDMDDSNTRRAISKTGKFHVENGVIKRGKKLKEGK